MSDFLIDPATKDLVIEDGDLVMITDKLTETRQAVWITLITNRGQWFKNIAFGIPYLANANSNTQLLGSKDKSALDAAIQQGILSNPEVLSIIEYTGTLNQVSGRYRISGIVESGNGPVEFEAEI